jgi:hypothetical protein
MANLRADALSSLEPCFGVSAVLGAEPVRPRSCVSLLLRETIARASATLLGLVSTVSRFVQSAVVC